LLGRYFGISAPFWLNLQTRYDLEVESGWSGPRLDVEVAAYAAAS
jgi:plasmid maintenance system antidote protein VapI